MPTPPSQNSAFNAPPIQTPPLQDIGATFKPETAIFSVPWVVWFTKVYAKLNASGVGSVVTISTHAKRLTTTATVGALFYETDRTSLYMGESISGTPTWVWIAGMFSVSSTNNLPTDLNATFGGPDQGFLAYDETLKHAYIWTGQWQFAPGDEGAGFIVAGASRGLAGTTPTGGVWHLCDGSHVNVSNGDGTFTSVLTPNLTGNTFLMGASSQGTVQPATSPTLASGSETEVDTGAGQVVASGSGVTVAAHTHSHTLTSADVDINAPSIANGGLPQYIALVWYIRQ